MGDKNNQSSKAAPRRNLEELLKQEKNSVRLCQTAFLSSSDKHGDILGLLIGRADICLLVGGLHPWVAPGV